jgi:hypothetical protein
MQRTQSPSTRPETSRRDGSNDRPVPPAYRIALVQHHRLVEDGAREQAAVDQLVIPGRYVPAIHEEGFGRRSLVERFFLYSHAGLLRVTRRSPLCATIRPFAFRHCIRRQRTYFT